MRDAVALSAQLLDPRAQERAAAWATDARTLRALLAEEYPASRAAFEAWLAAHSADEQRSLVFLATELLVGDEHRDVAALVFDVFPDAAALADRPAALAAYVAAVARNPLHCVPGAFDADAFREALAAELPEDDATRCVAALLALRQCVAQRLCLNLLVLAGEVG